MIFQGTEIPQFLHTEISRFRHFKIQNLFLQVKIKDFIIYCKIMCNFVISTFYRVLRICRSKFHFARYKIQFRNTSDKDNRAKKNFAGTVESSGLSWNGKAAAFHGRKLSVCCLRSSSNETRVSPMPTPFGIPLFDPKETYEAPAVTNGLWENNGFRVAYEHLRLSSKCPRLPFAHDDLFPPL